jgi:hypothetical protein
MMKVKSLLEALQGVDPDMDVVIQYDGNWFMNATAVSFQKMESIELHGITWFNRSNFDEAPVTVTIEC